ncbi:unnamed protein product [Auanema sp. JU1783]|nr:unnamed protein product [Auanema sp. JU1783]
MILPKVIANLFSGLHFSINPPGSSAFFMHSETAGGGNFSHRLLYLQNDCPSSTDQQLVVSSGNRAESVHLFPAIIQNLHCAVSVKLVQDIVKLDRPYVDVLAVADLSVLSFIKQTACVAIQITNSASEIVTSQCQLSPFEEGRQQCLSRIQIPYSWFGSVGGSANLSSPSNITRQVLQMSYTVSSTCNIPFYDRPQQSISLVPFVENAQAHTLVKNKEADLSLLSRANITLNLRSLNSFFVHLSFTNSSASVLTSLEIRLYLDARVDLISVSGLSRDTWSIRASTAPRPDVYTSIICLPRTNITKWDGYLFSLLIKMKGAVTENKKLERGEDGADAVLHWEIRMATYNATENSSDNSTEKTIVERVATKFGVTPDSVYALVPVAKSTDIVNTGILSGRQSATSMRVYTVSLGGTVKDVTSQSHCISAESKVLKTSPTCTTVYVDGSEMRGIAHIRVHVHFDRWTTSIGFTVWYPRLPIVLWVRDSTLNAIDSWPVAKLRELKENAKQRRRAAKQFSCTSRYQQTELIVLASFVVTDERTGERMYLSGNREISFDVTALAAESIQSLDRSIATVRHVNRRILIQATGPGSTRVVLKRQGIEYGGVPLIVTDEKVSLDHLSALPIVEMNINVERMAGKRKNYHVQTDLETAFTHRFQHGSLFYQLHYSDDTMEPLDDVITSDYNFRALSMDERVVGLSHKSGSAVDLIALDDLRDPSVELELRAPPHCSESDAPPLAATVVPLQVHFDDMDSSRLAVARVLAAFNSTSPSLPPVETSPWRMDTILIIVVFVIALIASLRYIGKRAKDFRGYENGEGRDEDTKEWVWLSKPRIDSNSIGSRYSQKSTINVPEQSSPSYDENTHTSISYRGSEISVFISPTPVITVHADRQAGGSWRSNNGRSRTRAARHALVDSSSDHNLARVVARSGSWREESYPWPNNSWSSKRRPPPNYYGMRESVA